METHLALDLIDDSYNANPSSVAAALDMLRRTNRTEETAPGPPQRYIAILGDMKELGEDAADRHAALAELEAMDEIDCVHCVGPLAQSLHLALPEARRGVWTASAEEMALQTPRLLKTGDVVLVKGSLSMKMARVVDAIRKMGHPGRQA